MGKKRKNDNSIDIDLDIIIRENSQMVKSLCYRMTWNRDLAEDAYQETWSEILKNIKSFKNKSKLSTWIYRVAIRTVLRHVKHEKIRSKRFIREYIESQTDLVDPLSQIDHEQWVKNTCNRCLTGFLYCLTKEDRIVFILRDILSIDYRKMEEIVGLNSVNIRQRIVRIRKRLNNFLERECILANPDSRCKCKIQNFVKEINLDQEFAHIRKELKFKNVYQIADTILPTLEYWKEKLDLMSHSSP